MKFSELNHVAIHVEDVERSCAFYRDILKLEQIPRPAFTFPGAWFRLGTKQELHIIGNRTDPVFGKSRGNHFALETDDLDAWERHFREAGLSHLPRRTRPDGVWQVFVNDPDGHCVELFMRPK